MTAALWGIGVLLAAILFYLQRIHALLNEQVSRERSSAIEQVGRELARERVEKVFSDLASDNDRTKATTSS